jgi:hypothetical protein
MRLDDVRDPDVELSGRREVDVDVPPRIDDRGHPGDIVGDERRQVPKPFDAELADLHSVKRIANGLDETDAVPARLRNRMVVDPSALERIGVDRGARPHRLPCRTRDLRRGKSGAGGNVVEDIPDGDIERNRRMPA